jgi:hypothetical protein
MCDSAVLYYHSTEPRHSHHHALEAMALGVPVVYMKQAVLFRVFQVFTNDTSVAAADSVREAVALVRQLIAGSADVAAAIVAENMKMLPFYDFRSHQEDWRRVILEMMDPSEFLVAGECPVIAFSDRNVRLPKHFVQGRMFLDTSRDRFKMRLRKLYTALVFDPSRQRLFLRLDISSNSSLAYVPKRLRDVFGEKRFCVIDGGNTIPGLEMWRCVDMSSWDACC